MCGVAVTVQGVLMGLAAGAAGMMIAGWPTKWAQEAIRAPKDGPIDWEHIRWMVKHHVAIRRVTVMLTAAVAITALVRIALC